MNRHLRSRIVFGLTAAGLTACSTATPQKQIAADGYALLYPEPIINEDNGKATACYGVEKTGDSKNTHGVYRGLYRACPDSSGKKMRYDQIP